MDIRQGDIAIIGMAGRFPGARSTQEFWHNLLAGRCSISFFSADELRAEGVSEELLRDPNYVPAAPVLADYDCFDTVFFGIQAKDAEIMDPQHRLLLEAAWSALEDAGYAPDACEAKVGVFAGSGGVVSSHLVSRSADFDDVIGKTGGSWHLGNDKDFAPTRVSYKLNLRGPSVAVQTACSTALVAVHLACQSLHRGECGMALAGAVSVRIPHRVGYLYESGNIYSSDGHVRAFDAQANGVVFGSGVGFVLLKPLADALADADAIYAVIKGSAINNDGSNKMSFMATRVEGQIDCMRSAFAAAGVSPASLGYIESHGTGTAMGDPIEVLALSRVFREHDPQQGSCALGSLKNNIGHLDIAAGIASLIKATLTLHHATIAPCINFSSPNPKIDFSTSPFFINTAPLDWQRGTQPRRAAVNCLGIGGTNAFLILEEAPPRPAAPAAAQPWHLLLLSARSEGALWRKVSQLAEWSAATPDPNLADLAFTLARGRSRFALRIALVVRDAQDLRAKLARLLEKRRADDCFVAAEARRGSDASVGLREFLDYLLQQLARTPPLAEADYKQKLVALADLFCRGLELPLAELSAAWNGRRIRLPTYPFERRRFPLQVAPAKAAVPVLAPVPPPGAAVLHPLLQENLSDIAGLVFGSRFHGDEFFLRDHVVGRQRILPGVAYLEMVRAAAQRVLRLRAGDGRGLALRRVVWSRPLAVGSEATAVRLALFPEDETELSFEVAGGDGDDTDGILHCEGRVLALDVAAVADIDLARQRAQCGQAVFSAADCYARFRQLGFAYGAAFSGLEQVWLGAHCAIARIGIPAAVAADKDAFVLHPSLMDAALQAGMLWSVSQPGAVADRPPLPFAVETVDILQPCPAQAWACVHVRRRSPVLQVLDVDICDDSGRVCVRFGGFTARVLAESPHMDNAAERALSISSPAVDEVEIVLQQPQWAAAAAAPLDQAAGRRQVLLVGATAVQAAAVSAALGDVDCAAVATEGGAAQAFGDVALAVFAAAQAAVRERVPLRLQVVLSGAAAPALGVAGLLRTVQEEHAQVRGQVIEVASLEPAEVAAALQDAAAHYAVELRWADGAVQQRVLRDLPTTPALPAATPWKTGGVYLITGGAGGLGRLLAQEIAQQAEGVTLVLAGRSMLDAAAQAALSAAIPAATVRYHAVDVGDAAAVQALVTAVIAEHGALHGVIHAAGVVKDSFVLKKTAAEWQQVLRPKVAGVEALDAATAPVDLDLFVVFSSLSALGNAGQADYAAANGYLDGFAQQRQQRVARGERWGRTVSVNWPYWADGGMRIDAATQVLLKERHGSLSLSTAQGWVALYQALASGAAQVLVRAAVKGWRDGAFRGAATEGSAGKRAMPAGAEAPDQARPAVAAAAAIAATAAATSAAAAPDAAPAAVVADWLLGRLFDEVAALLRVSRGDLDADAELSEYGFDSISLTALTNRLNGEFGLSLMPTVFFEYPSLRSLAQHLARIDGGRWAQRWVAPPEQVAAPAEHDASAAVQAADAANASTAADEPLSVFSTAALSDRPRRRSRWPLSAAAPAAAAPHAAEHEGIAIVGMSGRFPQADDLAAFWQNLISGRDSIEEIPSSRWDWQAIYGDAQAQANRSQSKWGGFIAGVDEFDPLFFGISPREAMLMDPHQRLLLQHAWAAIEDAGHAPGSLSGTATGVFIGTASSGYGELIAQSELMIEGYSSTGAVPSVGPNRISYFLNLHGPSEPIETACSSALVAVHRAVQAIRAGQCEQALVGGVQLLLTPTLHISFSKAGMLSEDGRCKTFSAQANGYVRGEGVGVLLLKRLSAAQANGDRIYAVIRGSAENHGGRANSLTAPNPRAQADLLRQAYRDAGIDVRTVGYIEAHGTGTPLGDPIEINALKSAFASLYLDSGSADVTAAHCALGSVKTNIGHLELAAGAAGLIKVLLQLQHGQLAPSLHCAEINPYIELDGTPFRLVREAQPWPVLHDARGQALPRRAGVSSFGFGGVNAHVVLEEYRDTRAAAAGGVTLLVLSARTPERLQAQAQQLLRELRSGRHDDAALADIAYTLQVGRDAMEERLGLIATSLSEAIGQLSAWCDHGEAAGVHHGQVKRNKDVLGVLDEDMDGTVAAWAAKGKFGKVLELWVKGLPVRWSGLPGLARGRRISLPTYAFAAERHWVAVRGEQALGARSPLALPVRAADTPELLTDEDLWDDAVPDAAPSAVATALFQEHWEAEAAVAPLTPRPVGTLVCVLAQPASIAAVEAAVRAVSPQTRVVGVVVPPVMGAASHDAAEARWFTCEPVAVDTAALRTQLAALQAEGVRIDALWYLGALDGGLPGTGEIAAVLQTLAASGVTGARLVLAAPYADEDTRCLTDAWVGFARSLPRVQPDTAVAVIAARDTSTAVDWPRWIARLWSATQSVRLESERHEGGVRQVARVRAWTPAAGRSPLRRQGVYLITGGAGGLGLHLARYLATQYAAELILVGRSPEDASRAAALRALEAAGATAVRYVALDISDAAAVRALIGALPSLNGVFHAAGLGAGAPLPQATAAGFAQVLKPKLAGTRALQAALAGRAVDFVCYFSSSSAVLGDFGSCDYAIGNRYQSAYASWRNGQDGVRQVAVQWPLWAEGGMGLEEAAATQLYLATSGQQVLETAVGLGVLEQVLASDAAQCLVLRGEAARLRRLAGVAAGAVRRAELRGLSLEQCVLWDVTAQASEIVHVPRAQLDAQENLAGFGFDSITLASYASALSRYYGLTITPSLFFSHATLGKLAAHLAATQSAALQAFYGEDRDEAAPVSAPRRRRRAATAAATAVATGAAEPIALIGLSGRFPGARDVAEFWQVLADGRDVVTPMPAARYAWSGASRDGEGCWLGVLPGVAEFDPLFFEISPREAELMDPRQRLLLQEAWRALEDAGYGAEALARQRIGMYVGVEQGDYQELVGGEGAVTSNHDGILAARLSYALNLSGPTMAINTACSSGLVALHQACQALRTGECETAIAAGVNLLLRPQSYWTMSQAGMLSPNGRCQAFDRKADGMVPGEAVVAVVVKRLSQAQAEGDAIHAVIRGS
ncbi:SDR family NAD(P)-dependent oxidoreductase, partial [Tahibacter harae]